jgi:prepilin-type N-terminal cleavage/methylation domain-containing protein
MNKTGFSLLELLVVIAIMGILLSIATLNFSQMSKKSGVEKEIQEMYADLMAVRTQSFYQKRGRSVTISSTSFAIYSSNVVATATPVSQKVLKYAVAVSPGSPPLQIDFDRSGFATFNSSDTASNATVCAQPADNPGVFDSIRASRTQLQMGKQNGSGCSFDNIVPK